MVFNQGGGSRENKHESKNINKILLGANKWNEDKIGLHDKEWWGGVTLTCGFEKVTLELDDEKEEVSRLKGKSIPNRTVRAKPRSGNRLSRWLEQTEQEGRKRDEAGMPGGVRSQRNLLFTVKTLDYILRVMGRPKTSEDLKVTKGFLEEVLLELIKNEVE